MIYKAPESEPMWDTWLYQEDGDYHLFFLSGGRIGRAVSQNLIDWGHLPPIDNTAKEGDWDESGMKMTGCTIRHKDKYYMSYGSGQGTPIGVLVSSDLVNWERHPANPILPSKAPYTVGSNWRDLSSYYDAAEDLWHGYLYATHESGLPSIAHLTSRYYIHWDYHGPVFSSDAFIHMEVPDYFEMNGKHYILFSSIRTRKDTSGRKDAAGTWYVLADHRDGPYHLPNSPLLLGSGRGRHDHYVGRTITYNGKRLLYHHTWGSSVTWGTPKLIHQERDDTLALKYWSDLDKLETRTLLEQDRIVCEAADRQSAIHKLDVQASDMMITFTINLSAAQSAGLFWRNGETNRKGLGTIESAAGLILDGSSDTVSIVKVDRPTSFFATTILCHPKDDYHQQKIAGSPQHIRILVRSHMAEVYINEKWLFCTDISDAPESGSIGMIAGSGEAVITDLRIAEIKPLEPPMVEK
jgi:beta-fructofuranosidase